LAAACYSPPLPEAIYGVGIQTLVRLLSIEIIADKVDLVINGAVSTTIEMHDYFPVLYFEHAWIGRRLEVIANLEMLAANLARPFPKVERGVFRYWMMGKQSNADGSGRSGWYSYRIWPGCGVNASVFIGRLIQMPRMPDA
jgi:hypothetical protein